MKNKKNVLKIFCLIILVVNLLMFGGKVYASESIQEADNFIQTGTTGKVPIEDDELREMSNMLYNALLIVAIIIAVIVGLVIGIQFMTGSVAQKAKIKETLIPYVAGCIVIFGTFGIWRLVVNILRQL